MSLRSIVATFDCDICGTVFKVVMDPAEETKGKALADVADEDLKTYFDFSIQHDMHLCSTCTRKADAIGDDEYQPTEEEIREACQP